MLEEIERIEGRCLALALLPDHVHVLIVAPPVASPDDIVSVLKDSTVEHVSGMGRGEKLEWKPGYGVVSVSKSHLDIVEKYIATQVERHESGKINDTLEKIE